ncbi:hypothetical protein AMELA_G00233970 [Ameiurus melas]|uniref:Uncharacterized protein n=1 Tax=Ameiurus melas TaxID=219545 RepID=A0A7J6A088_AMEME|nr:hypothetical protein AMELA_G00233970 [Ameiurus melas]
MQKCETAGTTSIRDGSRGTPKWRPPQKHQRPEAGTMGKLRSFWHNYKVLIVMGSGLGFIHWGWYTIKSNPLLRQNRDEYTPEPGIVSYVSPAPLPPLPEPSKKKREAKTKE